MEFLRFGTQFDETYMVEEEVHPARKPMASLKLTHIGAHQKLPVHL